MAIQIGRLGRGHELEQRRRRRQELLERARARMGDAGPERRMPMLPSLATPAATVRRGAPPFAGRDAPRSGGARRGAQPEVESGPASSARRSRPRGVGRGADRAPRMRSMLAALPRPLPFRPAAASGEERARERPRTLLATLSAVDGWLLAVVAGLCAFGLVMVYSASEALGYAWYGNPSYFFQRQLIGLGVGLAGMVVALRLDYAVLRRWAGPLLLVTGALLVLVLFPHVGTERLGSRRWFALGALTFQPSAIATLVAVLVFARWLVERGPTVRTRATVTRYGGLLLVVLVLIVAERDLGSAVVIAAIALAMLVLAGARILHAVALAAVLGVLGYGAIMMEAYRAHRLSSFANPFADPLNTGFQAVQSLYALGSGGVTGLGLGNSIQKYQWLPEAHTDFVFAIIGEELGVLGALAVLGAFVLLGWRGARVALRAPDRFGALVAGGITAWICVQAFVNIAAVTNVLPTTGIPLPFVSYGGSSLAMTLIAVGVLCNISAQGHQQSEERRAHVDRWRRDRGTLEPGARRGAGVAALRSRG